VTLRRRTFRSGGSGRARSSSRRYTDSETVSSEVGKMKYFDVLVNGRNFKIDTEDGIKAMGFYVQVYVEADNEEDAELKAVEVLKGEEKLRSAVKNDKSDPPQMFVNEFRAYDKKPKSHKGKMIRTGFAWYEEEDEGAHAQSRDIFR
jgi:hypothetical protein